MELNNEGLDECGKYGVSQSVVEFRGRNRSGSLYFYFAFDTTRRHIDGKMRYVVFFYDFGKNMSLIYIKFSFT